MSTKKEKHSLKKISKKSTSKDLEVFEKIFHKKYAEKAEWPRKNIQNHVYGVGCI